jgi:predicted unusual protein kinase regulating ubiquinone biosynthesis (AarF/ABC1/UbiB family)
MRHALVAVPERHSGAVQITRLGDRMKNMSAMKRKLGIKRILGSVSEAYGRMMLYEGLFQADGHPGNILVMKGA